MFQVISSPTCSVHPGLSWCLSVPPGWLQLGRHTPWGLPLCQAVLARGIHHSWLGMGCCALEKRIIKNTDKTWACSSFSAKSLDTNRPFIIVREIPTENEKLSSSGKYRYFEDPGPRAGFSSPPSFHFSTLVHSANGTAPEFFWELPLPLLTE